MFFNVGVLIKNDIGSGESMDEDIEPLNLGLKISSYFEKGNMFKLSNCSGGQNIPNISSWTQDVNGMYIRHSGRLLKVLCTFNLRPVPTGIIMIMKVMIMTMIIMQMISN